METPKDYKIVLSEARKNLTDAIVSTNWGYIERESKIKEYQKQIDAIDNLLKLPTSDVIVLTDNQKQH